MSARVRTPSFRVWALPDPPTPKALAQRCWGPPSVGTVPGGRLRRTREPWIQRPSRSVQARANGSRVHPFRPGRVAASLLCWGGGGRPHRGRATPFLRCSRWVSLAARPSHPPSLLAAMETRLLGPGRSLGESGPSPLPRASPPLPIGPRGTAAGRLGPYGQALARRRAGFAAAAVAPVAAPGSGGTRAPPAR